MSVCVTRCLLIWDLCFWWWRVSFWCLLAIYVSSLGKCLFQSFTQSASFHFNVTTRNCGVSIRGGHYLSLWEVLRLVRGTGRLRNISDSSFLLRVILRSPRLLSPLRSSPRGTIRSVVTWNFSRHRGGQGLASLRGLWVRLKWRGPLAFKADHFNEWNRAVEGSFPSLSRDLRHPCKGAFRKLGF